VSIRTAILKSFVFLRNFEAAQCFLVAQVGNLPYRRLAVGRVSEAGGASGLPIRDTADRLSALLGLRLLPRQVYPWLKIAFACLACRG